MSVNEYKLVILNEIRCNQKAKPPWWDKARFAQWSYGDWALHELYEIVTEHSTCPMMIRIEEFVRLMDEYACQNRAFSPAYDMAVNVLDICMAIDDTEGDLR